MVWFESWPKNTYLLKERFEIPIVKINGGKLLEPRPLWKWTVTVALPNKSTGNKGLYRWSNAQYSLLGLWLCSWLIQPQLTKQIKAGQDPLKTRPAVTEKYLPQPAYSMHISCPRPVILLAGVWGFVVRSSDANGSFQMVCCVSVLPVLWQFIDWVLINPIYKGHPVICV